ncbi:MAG: alpha/beta hydrolase family protein [Betaproteobacteria bacterium]
MKPLEIAARDGTRLGATLFEGGDAAVMILPATGVPQEYYAKFAAYLAEAGFTVLTFDYRGIGRSRQGDLRSSTARMRDWAELDGAAGFDFLKKNHQSVFAVGHSFGGQALGLLPQPEAIGAALIVGSQSGYWKNWPALGRLWMWPVTHFALPFVSRVHGYFPGSTFGFGEDLPKGVAIEWARWCRNPRYLVGDLGVEADYARFRAPLRAYAIADDPFAPLRAVEALGSLYPNSSWQIRTVTPREVGAERIGHFGFFRERFRDTLWRDACEWLAGHRTMAA